MCLAFIPNSREELLVYFYRGGLMVCHSTVCVCVTIRVSAWASWPSWTEARTPGSRSWSVSTSWWGTPNVSNRWDCHGVSFLKSSQSGSFSSRWSEQQHLCATSTDIFVSLWSLEWDLWSCLFVRMKDLRLKCKNLFHNSPTKRKTMRSGLNRMSFLVQSIPAPPGRPSVHIEGYWVSQGEMEPALDPSYILTTSVKLNLCDLARVVSAG